LNLLKHVKSFLGVSHLHGQIGLGKHDSNFFGSVGELSNCLGKHFLGLVKDFHFTLNIDKVQVDAGAFLLTERQGELLTLVRVVLDRLRVNDSWQLKSVLKSSESLWPILADNLDL